MAELTKQALKVENNTSFPNNNVGAITPEVLRTFNTDIIDSTVNQAVYTADSGSWNQKINALQNDTGSYLVTGSVDGAVLTFTKDDGTTFELGVTASVASVAWDNVTGKPSGLVSGSSQVVSILGPLNTFSASQETKDSTLASYTGSVNTQLTNLSTSQSIDNTKWNTIGTQSGSWGGGGDVTALNAFTASQNTKNSTLATYTGSVDTKFTTIGTQSGSWDNTNLNAFTSSQNTKNTTLGSVTASLQQQLTNIGSQSGSWVNESETGSFLVTASFDNGTRNLTFTKGNATTFAVNIPDVSGSGNIPTGSFATTGSNNFIGNQTITGSLSVSGSTTFIGSHIFSGSVLQSGSLIQNGTSELSGSVNITGSTTIKGTTRFENSSTTITGSLLISGSTTQIGNNLLRGATTLSGSVFVSGNIEVTNGANLITHNVKAAGSNGLDILANNGATIATMGQGGGTQANFVGSLSSGQFSASVITGLGSPAAFSQSVDSRLDESESSASLFATKFETIGSQSGSWSGGGTDLSSLNAFTQSQESKNTTLGTQSGSWQQAYQSTLALNTYTQSNDTKWNTLGAVTASQALLNAQYATTSSNSFNGNQTINGSNTLNVGGQILAQSGVYALNGNGITVAANTNNSGSAYSNINMFVDTNTDPTNVFSGMGLTAANGSGNITLALNSYAYQYPGVTIPCLIGFYQNVDGSDLALAFHSNGAMDVWKKSNFNYGISVTGSTQLQSFTASLQQGYAFVGGANGKTTTVPTSSFGGGGTIVGYATTGSNIFIGNETITGSLIQTGSTNTLWGQTTINNNTTIGNGGTLNVGGQILAQSGLYSLNGQGIVVAQNTNNSGSQYPGVTTVVSSTETPTDIYGGFSVNNSEGQTLTSLVVNSYTAQYGGVATPVILADGNNPDGNNTAIGFTSNGQMDVWKKSNFKYGVSVTGSLNLQSTLTASLQQGYVWVGGAGNRTQTVPTSSFGGGGAAFPYSGTASISGSLQVTGSMSGLTNELVVTSNTASIDFTKGNFFSITLAGGATTRFEVSNTIKGQTINIQINQPAGASTGSVVFSPTILFAGGNDYQATATGSAIDLLTLAAITGSTVLATSIKNFL
jgi:hypothetical protein